MSGIAIIGAGGFVGTRLIESLVLDDIEKIYAIVKAPRNLAKLCRFGTKISIKFANAQDEESLSESIKDADTVINLVMCEPSGIDKSTKVIYNSCVKVGVKRLIHLSSAVVYGQVESSIINDDSLPIKNHWMPYARAKASSELFLREVLHSNPMEIIVLRPGIIWGPRSSWSYNAAQDITYNKAYLIGNGNGICNTIYIDNLISCILTCHQKISNSSGFYNVSDSEIITWYDFYKSLSNYLGYDMTKMTKIPEDRFRPSFNSLIDDIRSSNTFNNFKKLLPEELKFILKSWLNKLPMKTNNDKIVI